FADFRRTGPGVLEDEKKLNAQIAAFEAAMFLPQDIERLRARGNAQELVGAALMAGIGDQSFETLTREAWPRGSNDPVILTAITKSLLREFANPTPARHSVQEVERALAALERLDSENGLPLCLRAYVQLRKGDTNTARLLVSAAMRKPALRT